jgi:hypothetical protein
MYLKALDNLKLVQVLEILQALDFTGLLNSTVKICEALESPSKPWKFLASEKNNINSLVPLLEFS